MIGANNHKVSSDLFAFARKLADVSTKLIHIASARKRCPSCITIGASMSSVAAPKAICVSTTTDKIIEQFVTPRSFPDSFRSQPAVKINAALVAIDSIG